ncbi:MAG: hypothetical protein ACJ8ER_00765 [Allosphingosinicella sp.]
MSAGDSSKVIKRSFRLAKISSLSILPDAAMRLVDPLHLFAKGAAAMSAETRDTDALRPQATNVMARLHELEDMVKRARDTIARERLAGARGASG